MLNEHAMYWIYSRSNAALSFSYVKNTTADMGTILTYPIVNPTKNPRTPDLRQTSPATLTTLALLFGSCSPAICILRLSSSNG
ncbi:hypothetical protein FBU59_001452 [Linderina macrospora]|uniref:Uncharacterized protein n=1 Tax=Linderina macrospora TaxID=4868 RepID=A0ACC1JE63_9FUNG|nr:hypothetical protein FBU59_001452 [Linderina macrospora]